MCMMTVFVDIDDCSPDPCENGASCVDGVNTVTCQCVAGWTGDTCETGNKKPRT